MGAVSIHAPAWGATTISSSVSSARGVSIHAPAWGATYLKPLARYRAEGFNPRARVD